MSWSTHARELGWWMFACATLLAVGCGGEDGDSGGAKPGAPGTTTGGTVATSTGGRSGVASGGWISNAGSPTGGSAAAPGGASTGGSTARGGAPAQGGASSQGGARPSAGGGFSSGLPGGATLESLSPDQLVGLCEAGQKHLLDTGLVDDLFDAFCGYEAVLAVAIFGGSSDEEARTLCSEFYTECLAAPAEPDDCSAMTTSTCSATVAELEACVDAYPEYVDNIEASAPECSELTLDSVEASLDVEPERPAPCANLWDKCPGEAGP